LSEQDVMRLVAEVVDKFTGPLKDLVSRSKDAHDALEKGHARSSAAAREHSKQLKELNERFEKVKDTTVELVTPALASVGIAGFSAAEAIKSVVEASRRFGETGRMLEMVGNRSGMSSRQIQLLDEAAAQAGISVDAMNEGVSNMGEFLDQTTKKMPEALQRWATMPLAFQKIGASMAGVTRDQAVQMALDFLPTMTDKGQQRQFLRLLGLPEDWASFSRETINDIIATTNREFKLHPAIDPNAAEKADEAWRHLGATMRGVRRDIDNSVGPALTETLEKIDKFFNDPATSEKIKAFFKAVGDGIADSLHDAVEMVRQINGFLDRTGLAKSLTMTTKQLWDRALEPAPGLPRVEDMPKGKPSAPESKVTPKVWGEGGMMGDAYTPMAFHSGGDDAEKTLRSGVKDGVLDAFREWTADQSAPGDSSGGGFTNAAFHPSGGGGTPRFGSREFPNLGNGAAPDGNIALPAGNGGRGGGEFRSERTAIAKLAAMDQLRAEGVAPEHVDEAASLLVGQAIAESGLDPNTVHDGGTGYGIYGAGRARRTRMLNWLAQNGYARNDLSGQMRYMAHEAMTDSTYAASRDALMNASPNNFEHGARVLTNNFESPRIENWGVRLKNAFTAHRTKVETQNAAMHGEALRKHFGHPKFDGSLLKNGKASGLLGPGSTKVTGDASLRIDLNGFPKGTRTASSASGMFKEVQLNRGRAMPMASQDS
jgi:hypothetical protein